MSHTNLELEHPPQNAVKLQTLNTQTSTPYKGGRAGSYVIDQEAAKRAGCPTPKIDHFGVSILLS